MKAVAITGVGIHSAGGDVDESFSALSNAQSALTMYQLPGVNKFPAIPGAPAANANPAEFLKDRKLQKYMSPTSRMAVLAAGRALRDAGLLCDEQEQQRRQMALFVTTSLIAFDPAEVARAIAASKTEGGQLSMELMGEKGFRLCHPLMPFKMLLNMPIGLISMIFKITGDNAIYYPDAVQAAQSLDSAARAIAAGCYDRALVGGVHHGQSLFPLCTLDRFGLLAPSIEAAQPFSRQHSGYAPADGAAFVVLESAEAATRRGADPLAVLDGAGAPELVLTTGSPSWRRDEQLVGGLMPSTTITSLDGKVGYLGPAAPLYLAAIGARSFARSERSVFGIAPGQNAPRRIQVLTCEADGRSAAYQLLAPGGIA